MDHYCVVMCGLQAAASDEASAWSPVAAAMKLDRAEFEQRVLAALPRIVRRGVDLGTAERIAHGLQAMDVDARVLQDDAQLAYLDRAGATRGPLPRSSLGEFIQPGESFRLRGEQAWQPWAPPREPEAAAPELAAPATSIAEPDPVEEALPLVAPDDEPGESMAIADDIDEAALDAWSAGVDDALAEPASTAPSSAWEDDADAAPESRPTELGAEAPVATSPPLAAPEATTDTLPDAYETAGPATDTADPAHPEPVHSTDAAAPASVAAPAATSPEPVDTATPARRGYGRIIVLLVLIALAVWAYRHWMADTRTDGSPAAGAVVQPASNAAAPAAR